MAKKVGRPAKVTKEMLTPDFLDKITKFCMLGATDVDIQDFMGMSRKSRYSLVKYRDDFPELDEAIRKGKEIADSNVSHSLYRKATGYEFMEVTHETGVGAQGDVDKTKTVTKHYASDVGACVFWLKNRRPDQWKDKREYTSDKIEDKTFEKVSSDELQKMIESLQKALVKKANESDEIIDEVTEDI